MKIPCAVSFSLVCWALAWAPPATAQTAEACGRLASFGLPNTTITAAAVMPAGTMAAPGDGGTFDVPRPACRVVATLRPSADSDIGIEVWLPLQGWNGKLMAVGNGAFTGGIAYGALTDALERGYATTSTDTGHSGNTAAFAVGHPEKVVDFGWRAVHEMTVAAKQLVARFYDVPARLSYWNGCSAGGRQGLQAAQRFPEDFDGIIAGAPGIDWTGRAGRALQVAQVLEQNPSARLMAPARAALHNAVVAACDAQDGVTDGLIGRPDRCTFDPQAVACTADSTRECLTPTQVDTARLMYSTTINPATGRQIPGVARGSELGWTDLGWTASARVTALNQFRFIVFQDPAWDPATFRLDRDLSRAEANDGNTINALDPNLEPFIRRGGKLIQYHGLADPQISAWISPQYYERVVGTIGASVDVDRSYRLFLAPGMGHCRGGEGPNSFDMVTALERWVEGGMPPDAIVASHAVNGRVDRTRPLCPYPRVATYRGSGSIDEAGSFTCALPQDRATAPAVTPAR